MGLRRDIKDHILKREEITELLNDPRFTEEFRGWARRWLERNKPTPRGEDIPEGNRSELDAARSPRGGKRKRARKRAKVSKRKRR